MTDMRNIFYLLIFFASLLSCSTSTEDTQSETQNSDTFLQENSLTEPSNDCDFVYDTIKNEKYKMPNAGASLA